jgi:hypothetical protein
MVTIKITIQQCLPTLKPGFNSSAYEGLAVPDQLLEIIISPSVKVIKKDKAVEQMEHIKWTKMCNTDCP